jgi:fatty-acyl-CoA synthase
VVLRPGFTLPPLAELRDWGGRSLARFKLPRRVIAVGALPLTSNLKIDRRRMAGGAVEALASEELA